MPSKYGPQRGQGTEVVPAPCSVSDGAPVLPSAKQLAWSLTRPRDKLTEDGTAAIARLEQDAEAGRVAALVRRFADLLRSCCFGSKAAVPSTTHHPQGLAQGRVEER